VELGNPESSRPDLVAAVTANADSSLRNLLDERDGLLVVQVFQDQVLAYWIGDTHQRVLFSLILDVLRIVLLADLAVPFTEPVICDVSFLFGSDSLNLTPPAQTAVVDILARSLAAAWTAYEVTLLALALQTIPAHP
jgi:hypothetical protein